METGLNGVQSTSGLGGANGNVSLPTGSYMNAPLLDGHGNEVSTFAQANAGIPGGRGHTNMGKVTESDQTLTVSPVLGPNCS